MLDIVMDNNLRWTENVEKLKNKSWKTVGVLHQLDTLKNKSINLIFNWLIMINISYGLLCWGSAYKTGLNEVNVSLIKLLEMCVTNNMTK